ncbi:MAG: hypothetical protein MUF65_05445 [Rubritepida sp.]|jgi:hypothetical protein|nr:hypothetical protein [Rubritepida sp.]MCU0944797.1 hypothetical protein [Rubritepida sp.]
MPQPRRALLLAAPAALLTACAVEPAPVVPGVSTAPPAPPEPTPTGRAVARVEIRHWQAGMIGQVSWGEGVLIEGRRRRPFRVRGLGVGGVGMARVRAQGEVFNMDDSTLFPGVYRQTRAGLVMPGAQMRGGVWLENASGVRMLLVPDRAGLAAQLGMDGILIEFT